MGDELIVDPVTRDVGSGRGDDDASSARHDHTLGVLPPTQMGAKAQSCCRCHVTERLLLINRSLRSLSSVNNPRIDRATS